MPATSLEALRDACAPLNHPSPEWLRSAGAHALDTILKDFLCLGVDGVGRSGSRHDLERLLREPPPEAGMDVVPLVAEFQAKVVAHSFRPGHPRFLAFIPGAPTFASILGDCLASNTPDPAPIETAVLDWFKQFLGYPAEATGIFTSGGSEANLTALLTARERISYDDRSRAVLYATEHRHWSVDRALKIVGMRPQQVRPVASDADFRLRMDALSDAVAEDERAGRLPWLVLATAGTTNTGSVDPLTPLANYCTPRNLWLHVDAAYGWPMALIDEGRGLLRGIDRADSITLDPHKWFAQPFDTGCLLVRDGNAIAGLPIAQTQRFRALKIWISVRSLGIAWFCRLIEHGIALAEYAQGLLHQAGCFDITSARKLGIVCFRYVPMATNVSRQGSDEEGCLDRLQMAIAEELMRTGRAFLSTTRLHGRSTLRLCFVNWRTTAADVEEVVALLQEIGARLTHLT